MGKGDNSVLLNVLKTRDYVAKGLISLVKSLPKDKNLGKSEFKAFADDIFGTKLTGLFFFFFFFLRKRFKNCWEEEILQNVLLFLQFLKRFPIRRRSNLGLPSKG